MTFSKITLEHLSKKDKKRSSEIIYQVYPSSFNDSNGDGVGDLAGITEKLDYIKSLNVDSIWISPFFLSPEGQEGDGGYAVTNYCEIDPRFGTLNDFETLLSEAHKRDLRIYTDFVLAHTAWDHEWFIKSRKRDPEYDYFYVWADGYEDHHGNKIPPNNWKSIFGGDAWTYDTERQQWYMHHFLTSQPCLNSNEKKVQEKMLEQMRFWLDLGIDGLRIDALPFTNFDPELRNNPPLHVIGRQDLWEDQLFEYSMCQSSTIDYVTRIRKLMDSYATEKTTIGEVVWGREGGKYSVREASKYTDRYSGLSMCYTGAFVQFTTYPKSIGLQKLITSAESLFPTGGYCNALSNHDFSRASDRILTEIPNHLHQQALKQLLLISIFMPGSICLYQGEELGLPQAKIPDDIPLDKLKDAVAITKGLSHCRDGSRTPMPWDKSLENAGFSTSTTPYLPVPESHLSLCVSDQENDPNSLLNFTRQTIEWQSQMPALKKGNALTIPTKAPLLIILRYTAEQKIFGIFNLSEDEMTVDLSLFIDDEILSTVTNQDYRDIKLKAYETKVIQ